MGLLRAALLVIAVLLLGRAQEPPENLDEYHVKAAYLVGFSRFIERQGDGPSDVTLCSAGDEHMTEVLKEVATGKTSGGRFISTRPVDKKDEIAGCTVLFISANRLGLLRDNRKAGDGLKTLIVGDAPGFLDAGGAIEFVWAGKKIQFNASLPAIQRSRLKVSSRLLNLARNLRNNADSGVAQ
jgi:hypothetical protein